MGRAYGPRCEGLCTVADDALLSQRPETRIGRSASYPRSSAERCPHPSAGGISDTFLGALWTLDFMLLLASYGCSGVNIETGVNQLGFVSSYSPIQDDGHGVNAAGVPYYGMLAFAKAFAGCDALLPLDFDANNINCTAYAMGS